MTSARVLMLVAATVFALAIPASANHVGVGADDGSFFGQAQDEIGSHSAKPHEASNGEQAGPAEQKPACGASTVDTTCEPTTYCVPLAESPTGYVQQTVFNWQSGTTDFSYGSPCTPGDADRSPAARLPGVVLRAFRRVPLPEPALSIQPPNGKTLVGLETIFSTKAEPFTTTLTLLGRKVTLKIEPSSFVWHHGDGTSQTTDWAGKAWDHDSPDIDGYLTHVYEHTGAVRPSVEVTWSAQFRVGGGAWRPVNGTVTRAGAPVPLQILEGQPVLNSY